MTPWAGRLPEVCEGDGEFRLMARYWTGALHLAMGEDAVVLEMKDGAVAGIRDSSSPAPDQPGHIGVAAPAEVWDKILAPVPPPFCNDIVPAAALGLVISGDDVTFWQYYPAVRRLVELLRADRSRPAGA